MGRFPEIPLDPPELKAHRKCLGCGEEILDGERAFSVSRGYVHFDDDCFWNYLLEEHGLDTVARMCGAQEQTVFDVKKEE